MGGITTVDTPIQVSIRAEQQKQAKRSALKWDNRIYLGVTPSAVTVR